MALTQINPALFAGATNTTAVIQSNGTTAITVDSSQNVGIKTSSPNYPLEVNGSVSVNNLYKHSSYNASMAIGNRAAQPVTFITDDTERMRIDSSGNVLLNTTTASAYFFNNQKSAITSAEAFGSAKMAMYSFTNSTAASNNATVTTLRFLTPTGTTLGNSGISGIVSVYVTGNSGANSYTASYTLNSDGNGTTDAALTIINAAKVRGTNPVSSIQLANDGGGGAIALTLTYINNSGVVTGGFATFGFHGLVSGG